MKKLVANTEYRPLAKAFGVQEFGELLESVMQRENSFTTKKSFAPSSFGGQGTCPTYWWYAFNGAEFVYDIDDPKAIAMMENGTAAGERIANLLDKAGILVEAERKAIKEDPPVFGYIDAVVSWKGEEIPAEVKTTKTETFQQRLNNNKVPTYQLLQLLFYMDIMNVTKGFFITEDKNTHELFILPVKMTKENRELLDSTYEWMRMVRKNALEGEKPKRPYTKSNFKCKGCPVKNTCWDGYVRGKVNGQDPNNGIVDLPPLELPK